MPAGLKKIFDASADPSGFNMTPIIDIVFLLIIFFLVVCQFIDAENFPVEVPDECTYADQAPDTAVSRVTLSVINSSEGRIEFAVGSEKTAALNTGADHIVSPVELLTRALDRRLESVAPSRRTVTLRIDEDISYRYTQYALASIAESLASNIQMAVLKKKR